MEVREKSFEKQFVRIYFNDNIYECWRERLARERKELENTI
ncbi:hypothetical protein EV144_103586 [Flavobacterium sp. 270]|nr:hypothetical protein EV144_103586 [Flavobacterium sp. 270]